MSQSLVDQLNAKKATPETLLEAMVVTVGELNDDLSTAEMRQRLQDAGLSGEALAQLTARLDKEPSVMVETALAWLAVASEEPEGSAVVEAAIEDADRNMVVMEPAAVTMVTMYAMYLIATRGGVQERVTTVELKPDGTFTSSKSVKYASFSAPFKAALNLFKGYLGIPGDDRG